MALNLSLSSPPIRSPQQPLLHYSAKHTIVVSSDRLSYPKSTVSRSSSRRVVTRVRSSLDTVGPTVKVGQVTEVDKDTFWPLVKAADDKTVVLDMYTQWYEDQFVNDFLQPIKKFTRSWTKLFVMPSNYWCGPCKVMAPKFQELSQKYLDVVFLKLDCNQENKPLAKELGIKVVPTFKILKDSKVVKEVTGAKFDDLVLAIEAVRSS